MIEWNKLHHAMIEDMVHTGVKEALFNMEILEPNLVVDRMLYNVLDKNTVAFSSINNGYLIDGINDNYKIMGSVQMVFDDMGNLTNLIVNVKLSQISNGF
jgi:hypothetical protein